MDDQRIIELFWQRKEDAIKETEKKYGKYCFTIANNILLCKEDSEECVIDAYIRLWNSIPPNRPNCFSSFIGRITRNLALDRYQKSKAAKRLSTVTLAFDELDGCLFDSNSHLPPEDSIALKDAVNSFLEELSSKNRIIFVRRYWYFSSVKDIARDYGFSQSDVKISLMRTREKFRSHLIKEGILIKKD